jgi:methyl-accepting chemotaxis protein
VKSTECGVTNDTAERRRSNAATSEISRKQAAQGTHQVSSSITDAHHGASESESASSQVLSAARSLSSDSIR